MFCDYFSRLNKIIHIVLMMELLLLSSHSLAANYSYTYLEANYVSTQFDKKLTIGNAHFSGMSGARLVGSFQFYENVSIHLGNQFVQAKNSGIEISDTILFGGARLIAPVEKFDLLLNFTGGNEKAEICGDIRCIKIDTGFYLLGVGGRLKINELLGINVDINRFTYTEDNIDSDTEYSIGFSIYPARQHSIRVEFGFDDDSESSIIIGYRFSFYPEKNE
jgi:hypothetical protein